jgi:hypothetical protein
LATAFRAGFTGFLGAAFGLGLEIAFRGLAAAAGRAAFPDFGLKC